MLLKRFDLGETCPGFPEDDRLRFRQERCSIVLLVEHLLKSTPIVTEGVRKVFLELEQRDKPGLVVIDTALSVDVVSSPFDFVQYFAADPGERPAMLAIASESALETLACDREWSLDAIRGIFAKIREANYELHADRAKACRSPKGTKRARVSYFVDREEFRIMVTVTGPMRSLLFQDTIYRDRPTAALCVHFTLGKPFWSSDKRLIVPFSGSNNPSGKLVVKIP